MQTCNKKHNLFICQCLHHFKRWYFLLGFSLLCLSSLNLSAQNVSSATIENGNSDQLKVTFSESIIVSNADGFRLVGGVARIERLLSGSGSNTLTFVLTDHVLPDDAFRLLHWPEMSDARGSSGKLGEIDQPVTKNVSSYKGNGRLYYVSTSGDNNNTGTSKGDPLRTVGAAEAKASPGDFILLRRGDVWDNANVKITKSGTPGNYLTIGAYGSGNKPIIYSKGLGTTYGKFSVKGATFAVHGADYVHVDNLHIKTDTSMVSSRGTSDGIQLLDCEYAVVSNCIAEAPQPGGYFGIRVNTWVKDLSNSSYGEYAKFNNTYPQVLNSEVFGYYANLGTQIGNTFYRGEHAIEEGGLIENCISRDPLASGSVWENIMINRGNFNGFIIRKNDVYGYRSNGIETYGSKNVVIEYNKVHDPANFAAGGRAIKAGGYNSASQTAPGFGELFSENIIVRYNTVYNITQGGNNAANTNGIDTNNGGSGAIYGNLIYNVLNAGIKIPNRLNEQGWDIYNNTILNCGNFGIQIDTDGGSNDGNVRIKNNIVQGGARDIGISIDDGSPKVEGVNNILVNNLADADYESTTDFQVSLRDLFVDVSQDDYRLKAGAPAIDAGTTNTPSYLRDIQGFLIQGNRDIGAYEFGGQSGPIDPNPTQGVYYAYYEGDWPNLPDFSSLTAIKTGTLPNFSLSPAEREDYYGFVQSAFLDIAQAGDYTFYVNSDDGAKLYVNGNLVVDNDGRHMLRERFGTVNLPAGEHRLRVEYFEAFSTQALEVRYSSLDIGISKQLIPDAMLFLEDDALEPPVASASVWLEAECGSVGSNWLTETNTDASNGKYLVYPRGSVNRNPPSGNSDDQVTFTVNVPQAGSYYLLARIKARDNATNSFWIKIDNQSWIEWWEGMTLSQSFAWNLAPGGAFALSAGSHTISFAYREGGTQLDKLVLSSAETLPSGPGGTASNCTTTPPPQPVVTADAGSDRTVGLGSTVQLYGRGIGPNPFRSYLWEKVSGPSLTLNARGANATLTNLQVGTYVMRFTATDSEGNSGSDEMTLRVTGNNARTASATKAHPAAEEISEFAHSTLSAYPNPANGSITVKLPNGDQQPGVLTLTDISGKVVHRQVVSDAETVSSLSISTERIGEGLYLLRWQQENKQQTFKLFVNR